MNSVEERIKELHLQKKVFDQIEKYFQQDTNRLIVLIYELFSILEIDTFEYPNLPSETVIKDKINLIKKNKELLLEAKIEDNPYGLKPILEYKKIIEKLEKAENDKKQHVVLLQERNATQREEIEDLEQVILKMEEEACEEVKKEFRACNLFVRKNEK